MYSLPFETYISSIVARTKVSKLLENAVPVHKKEDKNLLKNYRPINLLRIFGKIFERILFKDLFNYFHKTHFFTKHQFEFLPGDSCIS